MVERRPRCLLLSKREWRISLGIGGATAGVVAIYTGQISPWISIVASLTALTMCHFVFASRYMVAFPHIAFFISALQYVLAAWLGIYVPSVLSLADVARYLTYAGPVVTVVWFAWMVTMTKLPAVDFAPAPFDGNLSLQLDILLVVGLVATPMGKLLSVATGTAGMAFLFVLIGNLRYLSVFARMISRGPGWQWRIILVLAFEVIFAAEWAMFHPLLLWTMWTFTVWVYALKPRPRTLLISFLVAVIMLPSIQEAKWRLRGSLWESQSIVSEEEDLTSASGVEKAFAWVQYLGQGIGHTVTLDLSVDFLADTLNRYNQGWIIDRVITNVPTVEPFAEGETLKTAVYAALLPRALDPEKIQAGGRTNILRFAGLEMNGSTSMNLGYAGEMYANFGWAGGLLGCGIYALIFGLAFRFIAAKAVVRPLWWSVVPYLFFAALKAEDGIAEVLNWTVKGAIVFLCVYLVLPAFRRALSFHRPAPVTAQYEPILGGRQVEQQI